MKPAVTILLATYNSENFLSVQIESILQQTYQDWNLLISDGGSSDTTCSIIKKYIERFPEKITLLPAAGRLSCNENFLYLLSHCNSQYAMFSDHDDVWLPEKIKSEMSAMINAEKKIPGKPILVYTDMCICDNHMNVIEKSLFSKWGVPEKIQYSVATLTTYPIVSGCTFLMNRKLLGEIHDLPLKEYPYYDVLIALKNYISGGLFVYCKGKYILHRLHDRNLSGIKRASSNFFIRKLRVLQNISNEKKIFKGLLMAVAKICDSQQNSPDDAIVCREISEANLLRRIYLFLKVWGRMNSWKLIIQKIPLLFP